MAAELDPEKIAAAERHNRLAIQIVSQIVYAPICDGGTMSDVMMLCERVLSASFSNASDSATM